jgi:hypothetical protein
VSELAKRGVIFKGIQLCVLVFLGLPYKKEFFVLIYNDSLEMNAYIVQSF